MLELEKPNLAIIVASTQDGVIGRGNELPWHIREEFQHFIELTTGNTLVMGYNTFDSIVKMAEARYQKKNGRDSAPSDLNILPNRHIVVVSDHKFEFPGVSVVSGSSALADSIDLAKEFCQKIYIAGGRSIYEQMLPFVDELAISWIKGAHEGDIRFPYVDFNEWNIVETREFSEFTFQKYERKERVNYLDTVKE